MSTDRPNVLFIMTDQQRADMIGPGKHPCADFPNLERLREDKRGCVHLCRVQRFCIHDGPGIRTTVFFKGCPLRCRWCHNPECIRPEAELQFHADLCVGCGRCLSSCPNGLHRIEEGRCCVDFSSCRACGVCVNACPAHALTIVGRETPIADVLSTILRDRAYYAESDGGVTLSGGEPLMQPEATVALLTACRDSEISTCLDTSGYAEATVFERVAALADGILFDLKIMDDEKHRRLTGVSNQPILANFVRACSIRLPLTVRVPLVTGINDDLENAGQLGRFLANCGFRGEVELLPFHRLGRSKYAQLDRPCTMPDVVALPSPVACEVFRDQLAGFDLSAVVRKKKQKERGR